jgi:hypothetical protein
VGESHGSTPADSLNAVDEWDDCLHLHRASNRDPHSRQGTSGEGDQPHAKDAQVETEQRGKRGAPSSYNDAHRYSFIRLVHCTFNMLRDPKSPCRKVAYSRCHVPSEMFERDGGGFVNIVWSNASVSAHAVLL